LVSSTRISRACRLARPAFLAGFLAALAVAFAARGAVAQTEVHIDLDKAAGRQPVLVEGFQGAGDRAAARTLAVQADPILANDLEYSTVFTVTRAWQGSTSAAAGTQFVITGTLDVRGGTVTLKGQVLDFPARRLVGKSEFRGSTKDIRRLVHRFADDVVFQITGEAGVAQTQIAYVVKGTRSAELWVADYDGFAPRPLTAFKAPITSPAWSPSGREILFSCVRGSGWNVYGVPVAGGSARQVTRAGSLNIAPTWSPDGGSIAFASNRDGNSEIYAADASGSGVRRLTSNRTIDTSPAWAPNGQTLAFTSDRAGGAQVYAMDRDGGNPRRLIQGFSYSDSPDWSPNGRLLAFVVRTGGGFDIYVAGADGSAPRAIVSGGSNENPRWSPDGRQIVFSSNRDGARALWVTDLRGQSLRKLALGAGKVANPAWGPRPGATATGAALGSTVRP
jgi:TolB protein